MRVANQQHFPVVAVAVGVATVFVEALRITISDGVRRSTKVRVGLTLDRRAKVDQGARANARLSYVYVVLGIALRLLSCRWGFNRDNIGTRLDANLCLTPPTGEVVLFIERAWHPLHHHRHLAL